MTDNQTPTSAPLTDERNRKNRKRKAILASGAVLGVDAVVTLAAWNDTVFSNGTFGIGDTAWNVQGSVNGTDFLEYETSPGGTVAFTVDPAVDASNLMPGQTAKGKFWLKETKGNLDATITIQPTVVDPAANSLAAALRVTITADGVPVVSNQALSASGTATPFVIVAGDTAELEFQVTLPANANPNAITNTTTQAIWEMKAQSAEA
ncbi:SipW-dependent-type signal peptide-containing protein [Gordonia amicalis]|uniref:SipW-dependent-type signal peptide-containing protein n=1 Tax=Gordonia amicalis TaxID=89053 RepID=UPI0024BBBB9C|nr:SipW-dependent-type signal peptide-containing protein [Gordonia amicalis]MDJ0452161.1 SipW-dependent-type signal peptide-containing protein [Gordonia amicalis]MDV7074774.1 SipW-dependent-type signal peptide-containing protein [Gordonia amicalis]MDV7098909.1 SipW-dependent-type signal peptide-containing protein [Gordonia amicalis]